MEISLPRLQKNLGAVRQRIPSSTHIIAVVKANAYGHGVQQISEALTASGVHDFAVATLEEAMELRNWVSKGKILVFNGCREGEQKLFKKYNLTASLFNRVAPPQGVEVELKIDTGMGRLGIPWNEIGNFLDSPRFHIAGLFSHFSCAHGDPELTHLQIERFKKTTAKLPYPRHISNSAGLQFPEAHLDAVRLGLALYGIPPCPAIDYVKPILRWKTRILSLKKLPKGHAVGYCGTFKTSRESYLGILPVGYADGYGRRLSNCGQVRIRKELVPVVGQISMDLTTIDLTDIPNPKLGEEIVLLEDSVDSPISAANLARLSCTIPYDILTSIGERTERVYY